MLAPVRTVVPIARPVSLAEIKAHCRIEPEDTDNDAVLTALLQAAVDHLDGWTGVLGRCLVEQSWRQDFACFEHCMRLPLGPATSVTTITYFDGSDVQQTLSSTVYALFSDARGPFVGLKPDQTWPSAYSRRDAISVTYVAGVDAVEVPAAIRVAIMMLAAHWFEHREAAASAPGVVEMPLSVDRLITPYRRVGV